MCLPLGTGLLRRRLWARLRGTYGSDIRSEFGARFDDVVAFQSDASLTLRARPAWIHDWVSDPTVRASFETLPGRVSTLSEQSPRKTPPSFRAARNCVSPAARRSAQGSTANLRPKPTPMREPFFSK